ncbi:uncharacterized protein si:ch211-113e8.11 isoform X1 [Clupea harengus]|uniref:Uncharacterized protein si:ch211-113e8.11 isoform X1 n=1 Tax=Clupea harengus TaxID=7950 RepID=A0A6P8EUC5_CLUHA|nr:uncharacterized protein si:ch211-113e8.11 isoform X1 [Clupea harengus]
MNSLVCYGLSSDSDSDSDVKKCRQEGETASGKTEPATQQKKGRNFLLESGSASSDSEPEGDYDDDGGDDEEKCYDARTEPPLPIQQHIPEEAIPPASSTLKANKLPPPPLGTSSGLVGSSVFANPFKEQADERLNVLQKHVPLTLQARPAQIGGKKICIGYRKDGRCRFGSRCKFAHDSDLQNTATPVPDEGPETSSDQPSPTLLSSQTHDCQTPLLQKQGREEGGSEEGRMKKRRVGLSETLIPPKRALKQFDMQRQKDRVTPF